MLQLKNISKSFDERIILDNLSLTIRSGTLTRINGANGSGKSTLLKIIAKILKEDAGERVCSPDVYIGALIENPSFIEEYTLKENLLTLYRIRSKRLLNIEELSSYVRQFGLDLSSKQKMRKFSVGMKQKAGIIQAMMEHQNLIILDEPFRGLDETSIVVLNKLLKEALDQNKSIILVSHNMDDVHISADYELILENGTLKNQY